MQHRSHLYVVAPVAAVVMEEDDAGDHELPQTTLGPIALKYVGSRRRQGDIQPNTARNIGNHLNSFAQSYGRRPLDQLSHKAVERWRSEMHAAGIAKSTQALRLSSLRVFARWCVINDVVVKDWTLLGPRVRRPRVVPRDVTNEHAALVLQQARTDRELLIGWLMFGCGLRCVEVSRLDVEDLDRITMELHAVGKGYNERNVPMPPPVLHAWDAYLTESGHRGGALILHVNGPRRLGPERISGLIGRLFRDSGVKVRPYDGRSAHGLRAAGASDLYDVCLDPMVIQEFLGHSSLEAGKPYLRRAKVSKVRAAQNARPWADLLPPAATTLPPESALEVLAAS